MKAAELTRCHALRRPPPRPPCSANQASQIEAVLAGDPSLALTRQDGAGDVRVQLVVNVTPDNCANPACAAKASALATMLAPFGNATLGDGKVSGSRVPGAGLCRRVGERAGKQAGGGCPL